MIGDIYTWWVKTAVGSDAAIQITPTNYNYTPVVNRRRQRTVGGQLNIYSLVSSQEQYSLPMSFVTSADASVINSWWETNTTVELFLNNSVDDLGFGEFFRVGDAVMGLLDKSYNPLFGGWTEKSIVCKIRNQGRPFAANVEGRRDYFSGGLLLTTI